MSLQDYEAARALLEANNGDFEGRKSEDLVAAAEQALELKFPPSYRRFLLDFGCGDINGFEVYGIVSAEFLESSVPNAIWLTLHERHNVGLDPRYILIGEGGDGSFCALDAGCADEFDENPVVRISSSGSQIERIAQSFGAYLRTGVEAVT